MRAAVVVFPGSNCDQDAARALADVSGAPPAMIWHRETTLPAGLDLVVLPGGFSFGDYLRCGAIAARSPVMRAVADHVRRGGAALGVCNGWQILIEAGLLSGALLRNRDGRFVCRTASLKVETDASPFTRAYAVGDILRIPVAHHDGAFFAAPEVMARLEGEGSIAFRYVDAASRVGGDGDFNGSVDGVAGVLSPNRRVLGMMPHPERAMSSRLGSSDGRKLFEAVVEAL